MGGGTGPTRTGYGQLAQRANPNAADPMQNMNNLGFPNWRMKMGGGAGQAPGQNAGQAGGGQGQGFTSATKELNFGAPRLNPNYDPNKPIGEGNWRRLPGQPPGQYTPQQQQLQQNQQQYQQQIQSGQPTTVKTNQETGVTSFANPQGPAFSEHWNPQQWDATEGKKYAAGEERTQARMAARDAARQQWSAAGGQNWSDLNAAPPPNILDQIKNMPIPAMMQGQPATMAQKPALAGSMQNPAQQFQNSMQRYTAGQGQNMFNQMRGGAPGGGGK